MEKQQKQAYKVYLEEQKRQEAFQKRLKVIEEQRRSGQLGQQQQEWQQEQDKLLQ